MTFLCFQLQEAFAKGLLKPGMNVRVDKSKKYVNNMVSDQVTHLWTCFEIHSKTFLQNNDVKKAVVTLPGLQVAMKQCLADFQRNLPWVERLDMTNLPAKDVLSKVEEKVLGSDGDVTVDDDFQREMLL